jgi:6-phosphofructokinase 1
MLLQHRLKHLNLNIKSRPVELGYEIRCVRPTAFDLMYCGLLGYGVKQLFDEGITGAMVTSDPAGHCAPLYLKDVEDEHGKVKPRLVDMQGEKVKMIFENGMQYLTEQDYDAARMYLPDPEEYDFNRILGW